MSNIAATLKQQKEDFVSNLSGGTIGEINTVMMVAPVSFLPLPTLLSAFPQAGRNTDMP